MQPRPSLTFFTFKQTLYGQMDDGAMGPLESPNFRQPLSKST